MNNLGNRAGVTTREPFGETLALDLEPERRRHTWRDGSPPGRQPETLSDTVEAGC
jgi:hypothetical protein